MTKAYVYSKQQCPFCIKAKQLLEKENIDYAEFEVGVNGLTKEVIQGIVDKMEINVEIKTVPQIFLFEEDSGGLQYIGGFTELKQHLHK